VQHGKFGLGTLFTMWIPLFQSLGTPLTMLPFYWLNLGSLYLILIAIGTHYAIVDSIFSKTKVSCLVVSTNSTPLDILTP
jgi:hypothetical protein